MGRTRIGVKLSFRFSGSIGNSYELELGTSRFPLCPHFMRIVFLQGRLFRVKLNGSFTLRPKEAMRRLFNIVKRYGRWWSLTEYNNALKRAWREPWRKFCEKVDCTSQGARRHRSTIFVSDSHNPMTGHRDWEETVEVLLRVHVPNSVVRNAVWERG